MPRPTKQPEVPAELAAIVDLTQSTEEHRKNFFDLLAEGNTRGDSCRASLISETSLARYMKNEDFKAAVLTAEAQAATTFLRAIATCARGGYVTKTISYTKRDGSHVTEQVLAQPDAKAAAFWLQHKNPEDWGRDRVTGEDLRNLSDEELLVRLRGILSVEDFQHVLTTSGDLLPPGTPSALPVGTETPDDNDEATEDSAPTLLLTGPDPTEVTQETDDAAASYPV